MYSRKGADSKEKAGAVSSARTVKTPKAANKDKEGRR
jgi:hypothetical protein